MKICAAIINVVTGDLIVCPFIPQLPIRLAALPWLNTMFQSLQLREDQDRPILVVPQSSTTGGQILNWKRGELIFASFQVEVYLLLINRIVIINIAFLAKRLQLLSS